MSVAAVQQNFIYKNRQQAVGFSLSASELVQLPYFTDKEKESWEDREFPKGTRWFIAKPDPKPGNWI